jgi:hypothetical protein
VKAKAALPEHTEENPMRTTPRELFSNTLQKGHLWLNEVMEELYWEDEHKAYLALKAILHAVRDRLVVGRCDHSWGIVSHARHLQCRRSHSS